MKRLLLLATAMVLPLWGCSSGGSNPVTGGSTASTGTTGTGTTTTTNTIPSQLASNLSRISYDPAAGTLTVEMSAQDNSNVLASYNRTPALDVPGYQAFTVQDDPLDRMFVALVAQSPDGSVQAAIVTDGGQFNEYQWGGYYESNGGNIPDTGLVSYAGEFAGITNLNTTNGPQLLPAPAGTDPALLPGQPILTTGSIFLNVDFADNSINGLVYNHNFVDNGTLPAALAGQLPDANLTLTDIDADGEFLGTVEFIGDVGTSVGSYGGTFGGVDAASVAGIVALDTIFLPTDPRDGQFDAMVGVFVLPQCGTTGSTDPACP